MLIDMTASGRVRTAAVEDRPDLNSLPHPRVSVIAHLPGMVWTCGAVAGGFSTLVGSKVD